MPHSFGYRARTRDLFSRPFRRSGVIPMSTYLVSYRVGDIVDVVANSAIQKGMPHKFYHGKTGRVWNVTKSSVGVELNKLVRGRILKKRIHVRVEHVKKSSCRQDFLDRVKANDAKRREAKKTGVRAVLKRQPAQPRPAYFVKTSKNVVEMLEPVPYQLVA